MKDNEDRRIPRRTLHQNSLFILNVRLMKEGQTTMLCCPEGTFVFRLEKIHKHDDPIMGRLLEPDYIIYDEYGRYTGEQ